MIYLDNSATTRAFDSVASVVQSALTQNYFNASSPYKKALEAEKAVNAAAKTVASFLNCRAEELIFTSGGTESDNTALLCAPAGSEVIVSAAEHHAVLNCQRALEARGCRFRLCPVDNTGKVLPEILAGMVNENTGLVSIMHVNNETGTINDIAALTSAVKQKNPHTLFHSDGVQAFMHICANVKEMGVDLYSISAHKLHGPKGMGVLYIKKGTPFCPYLFGGGQQQGLRSGTVNTPGILGFAKALEELKSAEAFSAHLKKIKQEYLRLLTALPDTQVLGSIDDGAPNILSIAFCGIKASTLQNALEDSLLLGKGSACTSRSSKISHVLAAMQIPQNTAESAVRLSFGAFNTAEEAEQAASLIKEKVEYLRKYKRK